MNKICLKCGNVIFVLEGQTKVCTCGEVIMSLCSSGLWAQSAKLLFVGSNPTSDSKTSHSPDKESYTKLCCRG